MWKELKVKDSSPSGHSTSTYLNINTAPVQEKDYRENKITESDLMIKVKICWILSNYVYLHLMITLNDQQAMPMGHLFREAGIYIGYGYFSLRAGSLLSHRHERQRAKQSSRKDSGEEAPRKWAFLDLGNFFHFCFTWMKQNTIGWKVPKAWKLSLYYVWWRAIRFPWSRYFSAHSHNKNY